MTENPRAEPGKPFTLVLPVSEVRGRVGENMDGMREALKHLPEDGQVKFVLDDAEDLRGFLGEMADTLAAQSENSSDALAHVEKVGEALASQCAARVTAQDRVNRSQAAPLPTATHRPRPRA